MAYKIMLAAPAITLFAAASSAQTMHQISDLGVPEGALESAATAINSVGHVAGWALFPNNVAQPFVWIDGEMTLLPIPDGFPGATATGISDTGIVCGSAWSHGSFGLPNAVQWQKGEPLMLPNLGGQRSAAFAISPDGVVTGWSFVVSNATLWRGYLYAQDGSITDLGVLPATGERLSDGQAINAAHQVVGAAGGVFSMDRAYFYDPNEGMIEIRSLGGLRTHPRALSNAGHVVGFSETGERDPAPLNGMITRAFLWHKGRITNIGTLDGFIESRALAVNSAGTVVGFCLNHPFIENPRRAFVWEDGVMSALDDLIPPDSSWQVREAVAINESGQMVGVGLLNGQRRAILLTPLTEESEGDNE